MVLSISVLNRKNILQLCSVQVLQSNSYLQQEDVIMPYVSLLANFRKEVRDIAKEEKSE